MKQIVEVWYCQADGARPAVDGVLKTLRIVGRTNPQREFRFVEIDKADFRLTAETVERLQSEKAMVVLLVTPNAVLNDQLATPGMHSLVSQSAITGTRLVPVYCLPVPETERLPYSGLLWLPAFFKEQGRKSLFEMRFLDSALADCGRAISDVLDQHQRSKDGLTQPPSRGLD